MAISDEEEDTSSRDTKSPPKPPVRKSSFKSSTRSRNSILGNLRQSKTYESELDLVLEDLSEAETGTVCSDSESVVSFRMSRRDHKPRSSPRRQLGNASKVSEVIGGAGQDTYVAADGKPVPAARQLTPAENTTSQSLSQSERAKSKSLESLNQAESPSHEEKLLRYRLLNGCVNYQKLPQSNYDNNESVDQMRTCKSLPRNMKNVVGRGGINSLISTLDNMGSWPRKFNGINSLTKSETSKETHILNTSTLTDTIASQQPNYLKRRSLSPGKLKNNLSLVKDEKIHNLIEEARRMSSKGVEPEHKTPTRRPLSQPEIVLTRVDADSPKSVISPVSPYATCIIDPPEQFIRQPSYRIACSNDVKPVKVLPRSNSEDAGGFSSRYNYSYRQAQKILRHQQSDSILENQVMDSPSQTTPTSQLNRNSLVRAPSYRIAQSQSFDRSNRAPSYRKALESIPHERDSGLGSGEMTSSSDSNHSLEQGRMSSYRAATENSNESLGEWLVYVASTLNPSIIYQWQLIFAQ